MNLIRTPLTSLLVFLLVFLSPLTSFAIVQIPDGSISTPDLSDPNLIQEPDVVGETVDEDFLEFQNRTTRDESGMFGDANCTLATNKLCWCAKQNPLPPECSTIDSGATADYGGAAGALGGLGGLESIFGNIDLATLLQILAPIIQMIADKIAEGGGGGGNQNIADQPEFPVSEECLAELETLQEQLVNGQEADPISDECVEQLDTLLSEEELEVVVEVSGSDDGNNDDDDSGEQANDQNDGQEGSNDQNDGQEESDGAKACQETTTINDDCTPKNITTNDDGTTVTFGKGKNATTYQRTDDNTFIDEDGEQFTWEEVADLEGVSEEESDNLFSTLFEQDDGVNTSRAISIIGNILNDSRTFDAISNTINTFNVMRAENEAASAASNASSGAGEIFGAIVNGIGNLLGVGDIIGGGSYSGGNIGVINADGMANVTGVSLNGLTPDTIAAVEYVAQRVDHPLHITAAYKTSGHAPNSMHYQGRAVDVWMGSLTQTQKLRLVEVVLSYPGVNGFGYYNSNTLIHFDTRQTANMYWGTGNSYTGFNSAYDSGIIPREVGTMVFQWNGGRRQ